ncbi:MAG TPA: hypothetical protein VNL15_00850, partial [Dehalococcoidia bacterium]|nr:hypothetical protein [Dehalococcoidia bacterium]
MKHIVKPLLIAAFLAVAVMIFSVFASAQTFTPTPSPTPTSTPTPMATPSPSPTIAETPIHTPTPAASPAPTYNGTLKTGDWVQVRTEGDCLNVRLAPGLNSPGPSNEPSPVLNCLKDGFVGLLSSGERQGTTGPVFADGHWWWR